MTKPTLTDDMIRELCVITTRNEAGQHFTQWSKYYNELEELGMIEIDRPVHDPTGMNYDSSTWFVIVTDLGQSTVDANPELHPHD